MYIMAPEPISADYLLILPISVCLCLFISLSLLGNGTVKNVTATTNTHATIEELLEASFSMRSVPYQEKYAISSSQAEK
jgi:hypothetical protein